MKFLPYVAHAHPDWYNDGWSVFPARSARKPTQIVLPPLLNETSYCKGNGTHLTDHSIWTTNFSNTV